MDNINNPFETLSKRLENIEKLLVGMNRENKPEQDHWMNVEEASDFTGIPIATIRTKVHKREMPCVKRFKRLYFSLNELNEWMKEGKRLTLEEMKQQVNDEL